MELFRVITGRLFRLEFLAEHLEQLIGQLGKGCCIGGSQPLRRTLIFLSVKGYPAATQKKLTEGLLLRSGIKARIIVGQIKPAAQGAQ